MARQTAQDSASREFLIVSNTFIVQKPPQLFDSGGLFLFRKRSHARNAMNSGALPHGKLLLRILMWSQA